MTLVRPTGQSHSLVWWIASDLGQNRPHLDAGGQIQPHDPLGHTASVSLRRNDSPGSTKVPTPILLSRLKSGVSFAVAGSIEAMSEPLNRFAIEAG